jgi:hypothetical protein
MTSKNNSRVSREVLNTFAVQAAFADTLLAGSPNIETVLDSLPQSCNLVISTSLKNIPADITRDCSIQVTFSGVASKQPGLLVITIDGKVIERTVLKPLLSGVYLLEFLEEFLSEGLCLGLYEASLVSEKYSGKRADMYSALEKYMQALLRRAKKRLFVKLQRGRRKKSKIYSDSKMLEQYLLLLKSCKEIKEYYNRSYREYRKTRENTLEGWLKTWQALSRHMYPQIPVECINSFSSLDPYETTASAVALKILSLETEYAASYLRKKLTKIRRENRLRKAAGDINK